MELISTTADGCDSHWGLPRHFMNVSQSMNMFTRWLSFSVDQCGPLSYNSPQFRCTWAASSRLSGSIRHPRQAQDKVLVSYKWEKLVKVVRTGSEIKFQQCVGTCVLILGSPNPASPHPPESIESSGMFAVESLICYSVLFR